MFDTRSRWLNGWGLFIAVCVLQCALLSLRIWPSDLTQASVISGLIAYSVQISVPCLYLAFAASAMVTVLPGSTSRWLMRNRRMLGLAYAVGMCWQAVFIAWLLIGHLDYYHSVADNPYDLAEEIPGYVLLAAMALTSFNPGRSWIGARHWRWLHTLGIYYLWAETWGTYWHYVYAYPNPIPIYHVYYWAGLGVWLIRLIAWQRETQLKKVSAIGHGTALS